MRIILCTIILISFFFSQDYDYSLEDINPTSPTYGQMIGPSYFTDQDKFTIHVFSHQN